MKVTVAVRGRFHGFHLARELERMGALARLITTYPRFETARYGLPPDRVSSLVSGEVMQRAWGRLPRQVRSRWNPALFFNQHFERWAARQIPADTDVLVAWSGSSLACLERARALGARTVLERGSAHIVHQVALLEEEYERLGIERDVAHPGVIEKELCEYSLADRIAVPSRFAEESFVSAGVSPQKLVRLPYGVCTDTFAPRPKKDETFRVLFAGYASLQKGCHYLLQAFHELGLPGELSFAGGVAPELEPFIDRFGGSHLRLLGHRPERELPEIYAQASVFCCPSLQDGFGLTVTQAMACGLPIVVSENTGAADLVSQGRAGRVVPARDVESLKEALQSLYEQPHDRDAMGRRGRETVCAGFTWGHYGVRALETYRELRAGERRVASA